MSTHNICFRGEIRKILCGYPLLFVAMMVMYGSNWRPLNLQSDSLPTALWSPALLKRVLLLQKRSTLFAMTLPISNNKNN